MDTIETAVTLSEEDTEQCIDFYMERYHKTVKRININIKKILNDASICVDAVIYEQKDSLSIEFKVLDKKASNIETIPMKNFEEYKNVFGLYSFCTTKNSKKYYVLIEPARLKNKDFYDNFYYNLYESFNRYVYSFIRCIKFNINDDRTITDSLWKIFYVILFDIHKRHIPNSLLEEILCKLNYYGYTEPLSIDDYNDIYTKSGINIKNFRNIISGLLIYMINYLTNTKNKDILFLENASRIVNDLSTFYFENIY